MATWINESSSTYHIPYSSHRKAQARRTHDDDSKGEQRRTSSNYFNVSQAHPFDDTPSPSTIFTPPHTAVGKSSLKTIEESVKSFLEDRPKDPLELEDVSSDIFQELKLDESRGLRYDYYLDRLILQFPSAMHEAAVTWLTGVFTNAITELRKDEPTLLRDLFVSTNRDIHYADGSGSFTPDLAIRAQREDVFIVEVAFTQPTASVRDKVARILEERSVLAVLVLFIKETPPWSSPGREPTRYDWTPTKQWFESLEQRSLLARIKQNGIVWVENVEVYACLYERGWDVHRGDPERFDVMNMSQSARHALNNRLNSIWLAAVYQAIGRPVETEPLQFDWRILKEVVATAMPDFAHFRYLKWIGHRKRSFEEAFRSVEQFGSSGGTMKRQRGVY